MEGFKMWRDSYTPWFSLQSLIWKICLLEVSFRRQLEIGNYFFDQLEPTFLANYDTYNGKPLFRLVETSFFYLSVHSWQEKLVSP